MAGPGSGGRPRQGPQPMPEVFRPVGLAGGIDTKTDYKLVAPPKTLQALNVRYGTAGSVRKRYGISALGALTGAISVLSTQTELLACDNANMYAVNVGTGALTNRGYASAAAVASSTIVTLGTFPTQTLRTMQVDYLSVGGVNYGLAAYEYGYNVQTTGTLNDNGMDVGNTIYLVLFNASTGATIWKTSTQGLLVSTTAQMKLINPAGTVALSSASFQTTGASHPCITAYKGQFIVSFIGASLGNTITDSGTTIFGCLYSCQSFTFVPTLSATPAITGNALTNATACYPFPTVICVQPASAAATFSPNVPLPMFYDIRQNGNDVLLWVVGQNYSTVTSGAPNTYRAAGAIAEYTNAASFTSATYSAFTSIATTTICPLTLAASTMGYGLVYAVNYVAQLLAPTYSGGPALSVGTANSGFTNTIQNNNYNTPFSAVFTPSATAPSAMYVTDGAQLGFYVLSPTPATNFVSVNLTAAQGFNPLADSTNTPTPVTGGQLASRAFIYNGTPCAWVYLATVSRSSLNTLTLIALTSPAVMGSGGGAGTLQIPLAHAGYLRVFNPGVPNDIQTVAPTTPYARQACNVAINSATGNPTIVYAANTNTQENILSITGLGLISDTLGTGRASVRTPQGILYLGADPKYYDGNTCRTMGWLKIPEYYNGGNSALVATSGLTNYTPSNSQNNAGLYFGGPSTYTFFFVFVDYDAQGNTIYGSPSPAFTMGTVTFTSKTVLFIPSYMIPSRGFLQVYRNSVLNPLTYVKTRQFGQTDIKSYGTMGQGVVDDTGTGSAGATELLSGGLLYSPPSGGEIANDPPPASSMGVATKQRIFLVSQEVPSWVYFSKPFYPGRAPEFASGQLLDIDPTTGPITGIAALDTTIVIFKKGYIYSFGGDGPDATGNGSFTPTSQIASDTGCIDTPSVLTTEQGVWFRSTRGLQMLSRGGQVTYAAPEVEGLLQGTTVVSSSIVAAQNQLRFALASGNVLVFDYLLQAWSVFVFFRPGSAVASPPTSQTTLGGTLYTANAAGDLCVEGTGFQDGTNNLALTLQSAWINVAGPQGWGRIRRVSLLGDFRSAHTLTMSFSYDFASTAAYNIPYTASTTAQQNPYNWRVRAPRQVCQAVQITLTDSAPVGEGAVITGLVLELGPKSQALRVPDTQSV